MSEEKDKIYELLYEHHPLSAQARAERILGESLSNFADSAETLMRLYKASDMKEITKILEEIRARFGNKRQERVDYLHYNELKKGYNTLNKTNQQLRAHNIEMKKGLETVRQRNKRLDDAVVAWRNKYFDLYAKMYGIKPSIELESQHETDNDEREDCKEIT